MLEGFRFSSDHKNIAINTVSQLIGRIFATGTTFIISILLVRQFSLLEYGDFVKITTFITPLYLVADFGMNAVFIQYSILRQVSNESKSWFSLFFIRIFIGLCIIIGIFIFVSLIPHGVTDGYTDIVRLGILLYAPTILFQSIITSANAVFQQHLKYSYAAWSVLAGSLVSFMLIFCLIQFPQKWSIPVLAALSIGAGSVISAVASLIFTRRFIIFRLQTPDLNEMTLLFKSSIPLGITLIFNLIYFRIDTFILTLTRSTTEVGIYGFIYKIFETSLIFPTFFMNALYPMLLLKLGVTAGASIAFRRMVVRTTLMLLCVSVLVMILFYVSADALLFLKPEFNVGVKPFRILTLGIPVFYLTNLTMWLLISLKKNFSLLVIYGLSMIINIILNILFIPSIGIIAASWITVISELFIFVLSVIVLFRYNFRPPRSLHEAESLIKKTVITLP